MKFTILLLITLSITAVMSVEQESTNAKMRTEERRNVMAGGYRECPDLQNPRLQEVAEFATSQQFPEQYTFSSLPASTLSKINVKIVRASQQVVAGMNYRLLLLLVASDDSSSSSEQPALGSCVGAFTVTVYDRFGTLEVTSWGKEVECSKAKALLESNGAFFEWSGEHSTATANDGNNP
jgi:Cystatin domain